MHTLSYSQAEMETLLTKVLSHTCKQQQQALDKVELSDTASLLLSAKNSTFLADFFTDCALIKNSPDTTVYFISFTVTIQDAHLPVTSLRIHVTTPEQQDYVQLTTATLTFIKQYLLDTRIIPNPYDIA